MNILVTGGAGGIGSTLCMLLTRNGHTVHAFDNLNNGYFENLIEDGKQVCNFIYGDIRNTDILTKIFDDKNIQVVVHLAALTSLPACESDPAECMSVNVSGTASILDAARKNGIKVICASTSAIYENNNVYQAPFAEELTVAPRLFYPLSKKLMEEVIQSYIENYDMDITTLRFFNVFGPRQDIHRKSPPLINYIVRQIKNKEKLTFFSNGEQLRDYVHVDDVVSMIEACINSAISSKQTYNLCSGTLTSVKDIIGYAEKAFGKFEYEFLQADKYWSGYDKIYSGQKPILDEIVIKEVNKYSLGSINKAKSHLKWEPNQDIEKLMIETMKRNMEIIK
jgi:UDP-glucose 4-epimerase